MSDSWLNAEKYLGRYCYPKFDGCHSYWKRRIRAYRVRHLSNGAAIPEVKVWRTLGWIWVPIYDIQLILNYYEA